MNDRSIRRHQAQSHMRRRLNAIRNQFYNFPELWRDNPRARGRLKEQPQGCSLSCCGNPRRHEKGAERLTIQERRCEAV